MRHDLQFTKHFTYNCIEVKIGIIVPFSKLRKLKLREVRKNSSGVTDKRSKVKEAKLFISYSAKLRNISVLVLECDWSDSESPRQYERLGSAWWEADWPLHQSFAECLQAV